MWKSLFFYKESLSYFFGIKKKFVCVGKRKAESHSIYMLKVVLVWNKFHSIYTVDSLSLRCCKKFTFCGNITPDFKWKVWDLCFHLRVESEFILGNLRIRLNYTDMRDDLIVCEKIYSVISIKSEKRMPINSPQTLSITPRLDFHGKLILLKSSGG